MFGAGRRRVCGRTKRSTVLNRAPVNRGTGKKNRDCETQYDNEKGAGRPKRAAPSFWEELYLPA